MLRKEKLIKLILGIGIFIAIVLVVILMIFSKERLFMKSISYAETPIQYLQYSPNSNFQRLAKSKKYQKTGTANISFDGYHQIDLENHIEESSEIKVSGQVNGIDKLSYIEYNWMTGDTEVFKTKIIRDDEQIGIKSDEIVNGYVSVKNENLIGLLENLEIEFPYSIQKVELNSLLDLFTLEDIEKQALKEYQQVIEKNTKGGNYTKVKEIFNIEGKQKEITGYQLSLSKEEVKNLLISLCESLKQDSITLNMISQKMKTIGFSEEEANVNQINTKLEEIQLGLSNGTIQTQDLSITVFSTQKKCLKIDIAYGGSRVILTQDFSAPKVTLEWSNGETILKLDKMRENDNKIIMNIQVSGINNKDITAKIESEEKDNGVANIVEVDLSDEFGTAKINYIEENIIDEEMNTENLEELNENNSVILNQYSKEQLTSLLEAIKNQWEYILQIKKDNFFITEQ